MTDGFKSDQSSRVAGYMQNNILSGNKRARLLSAINLYLGFAEFNAPSLFMSFKNDISQLFYRNSKLFSAREFEGLSGRSGQ